MDPARTNSRQASTARDTQPPARHARPCFHPRNPLRPHRRSVARRAMAASQLPIVHKVTVRAGKGA